MDLPRLIPVVHVLSPAQVAAQCDRVLSAGLDAVFLINHDTPPAALSWAVDTARASGCGFVGINALGLYPDEVFTTLVPDTAPDAVWSDNVCVTPGGLSHPRAERANAARAGSGVLYFGGVAFKYQPEVPDLGAAAREASGYLDVLCTSGPATAAAPATAKIAALVAATPCPVAVASGVDVGNIAPLAAAGASSFLVASSVSKDWYSFDQVALNALAGAAASLG